MTFINKARVLDVTDAFASYKPQFQLPENILYLDGNSLGAMPKSAPQRAIQTMQEEWATGLIRSWNDADWINAPLRLGNRLCSVLGAKHGDVLITDTISINLFKLISYALSLTDKQVILSEAGNFPSDVYMANGIASLKQGVENRLIPAGQTQVEDYFSDDVGVAVLSEINYKTGHRLNIKEVTKIAKEKDIIIIWDLAHSAGSVDLSLDADGVDFAVGCTYKYLNGGPGSPAFVYVRSTMQGKGVQPISGWFSHKNMFAMDVNYIPDASIKQFQTGTYSALAYNVLEESLKMWEGVDMNALRQKSLAMTDFFMECMAESVEKHGLKCITPFDSKKRGSQVSYVSDSIDGYAVIQALIGRGVIGDYRAPNVMRFGFAPLYLSFEDVALTAQHYIEVLDNKEYLCDEFTIRHAVT